MGVGRLLADALSGWNGEEGALNDLEYDLGAAEDVSERGGILGMGTDGDVPVLLEDEEMGRARLGDGIGWLRFGVVMFRWYSTSALYVVS